METHHLLRYSMYETVCSVKMQALPPRTKDRWLGVTETILHELTFLRDSSSDPNSTLSSFGLTIYKEHRYCLHICFSSMLKIQSESEKKNQNLPLVCWNFWGRGDLFFISPCTSHFINNLSQCSKAEIKQTPTWSFCVHNVGSAVPLISLHLLAPAPSPLAKPCVFCSGACTAFSFTWHAAWVGCCWLGSKDGDSPPWPHFHSSFIFNFLFTKSCMWLGLRVATGTQLNQNLILSLSLVGLRPCSGTDGPMWLNGRFPLLVLKRRQVTFH